MKTATECAKIAHDEIVIVIPNFVGGGAERAAINLARALKSLGAHPRFLVEEISGALASEAYGVAKIDALNETSVIAKVIAIRRHMKMAPNTTFIAFMTRSNILCSLARTHLKRRPMLILTEHNNRRHLLGRQAPVRRTLSYLSLLFSFHAADKVICVSDGILGITRSLFRMPSSKLTRIYNPIVDDAAASPSPTKQPLNLGKSVPRVIAAGRLHPQKDFPTLIRAAHILNQRIAFTLTIYGEGPEREKLQSLIDELQLNNVVSLPGFTDALPEKISNADLFVLSSVWEGFGNVIAEALAVGTPVISTDCEYGPREILEDGRHGRLTPVGDAEGMAAAMWEMLTKPKPVTASAADRFKSRGVAGEYMALIDSLNEHWR